MKEGVKYAGGLLLAALLFAWVLRGTDPAAVVRQVASASPALLIGCAVLNFGHNVFRVWRWRALLAPTAADVSFRAAFVAVVVGYLTTWAVPGRLGELVRPLLLSSRAKVPLGPCIGTVVADRLLDAATLAALFAVGSFTTPLVGPAAQHADLLRRGSVVLVVGAAVGLAAMLALARWSPALGPRIERGPRALRWIAHMAVEVSHGATALARPRLAVRVAFHSLAAWLSIALGTWLGIRAVGAELSFGAVLVILPMLALGVALPTPGGAGGYHGAMKVGLVAFGIAESVAVSAGLVIHVLITVPILVTGCTLLWTEGISWHDIRATAQRMRRMGTPGAPSAVAENVS